MQLFSAPRRGGRSIAWLLLLPIAAAAEPLHLSQAPAPSAHMPAPNVILSVDNAAAPAGTLAALRSALGSAMADDRLPAGSIRLGWQDQSGCARLPVAQTPCSEAGALRVLDAPHRARFQAWATGLASAAEAPPHHLLYSAGTHLARTDLGAHGPWAAVPGHTEAPLLACRKAYHVLLGSGAWSAPPPAFAPGIGDADGTARTLPDGTPYQPTSSDARPFRDDAGSTGMPTLADLAFHFWATDLQPGLANAVPRRPRDVQAYWQPRNDPASWQHLTTYTVGLQDSASATADSPSEAALLSGEASWPAIVSGSASSARAELRHAALNGRGAFHAATPSELSSTLAQILDSIRADHGAPPRPRISALLATPGAQIGGATVFSTVRDDADWHGDVQAVSVATRGAETPTATWGTQAGTLPAAPVSTASLLDAPSFSPDSRLVLSASDGVGTDWRWERLSAGQQAALNAVAGHADGRGEQRLAYLRGDRTLESSAGGPFRTRRSRQGDIVNSQLWWQPGPPHATNADASHLAFRRAHAERAAMLYVGGNDGMLHAFAAASGEEQLAYVPEGLHAVLSELTRPGYQHRYFVDGSPMAGDLQADGAWRTYLAGFPGAGGRGYFVLDVTDPAQFATTNAVRLVVLDKTVDETLDADVGHIVAPPVRHAEAALGTQQITRLNDGRWALVMGNGYNSPNARPVLLVQYLDGARELRKLVAGSDTDEAVAGNGLGAPRLVDLDGDRIPDLAYAGDLAGRLWKFTLGRGDLAWGTAFGGTPLFVATDAGGRPQPITAAPLAMPHPAGGLMLVLGTGRHLTDADRGDTATQSIYGLHDPVKFDDGDESTAAASTPITRGRAALVAQDISAAPVGGATASGARLWTLSSNAVAYSGGAARRGWYVDLPERGERVLAHPSHFDGLMVDIASVVPDHAAAQAPESCTPRDSSERRFLTTLNALDGAAPRTQLYAYTPSDGNAQAARTASRIETGLRTAIRSGTHDIGVCPPGSPCEDRLRLNRVAQQPSWRLLH